LKIFAGEIHPNKLVSISEEDFRANGITKQKGRYLRLLAEVVIENPDFFKSLEKLFRFNIIEKNEYKY
jgi:3-methyladenine DNA glycosylase/8-oxoguanine DNA glycosylase